jgi:nicotinamide riboside transporter PnuC
MNKLLEQVGAVTGIFGAILIAANFEYSKWGFVAFVISSACLAVMGYRKGMYSFFGMQLFFQVINFVGIYRWFL